jgi:ABC-type sulfate transport system permease component
VLLPLSALVLRPATLGISGFVDVLLDQRVLAALSSASARLSSRRWSMRSSA